MMLNQLGLQASGAMGMAGMVDRQFRLNYPGRPDQSDPSAATGRGSDASNMRALANVMQHLTQQLLPQQHRLLALPLRMAATEIAVLLEAANLQPPPQQQQAQQGPAAAAAGDAAGAAAADGGLRGQASTISTLSRLVSRSNEAGGAANASSYLRDGRISVRHPVSGGLINVAINPSLLSPGLGPGSSLWQTLEALGQPAGMLGGAQIGAGGVPGLADMNDAMWDEAVNQLLEVLAPNGAARGTARLPAAGLAPGQAGRAAAAGAGDAVGLDPRE
jgi:hypothetical protein